MMPHSHQHSALSLLFGNPIDPQLPVLRHEEAPAPRRNLRIPPGADNVLFWEFSELKLNPFSRVAEPDLAAKMPILSAR